jgi:hypothetical protein
MRIDRIFTAIFGGLIPILGIGLLVGSALVYRANERSRESGFLTTGTVVAMAERYDEDGDMLFAPVVRYTTTDGKDVEFTGGMWSRPASYAVGDTVEVFFQPGDPHGAEIDTTFSRYAAPAVLGLVGLVFAAAGLLFLVVRFLVVGRGARPATSAVA